MNTAFIPMRRNSTGTPGKHMRMVGGMPVCGWTIASALQSERIDHVVVVSDDTSVRDFVACLIKEGQKRLYFITEPSSIAEDYSTDYQVCLYTLARLEHTYNMKPELIVHLRATHVLREPSKIDEAINEFQGVHPSYDSLRSINIAKESPYKMWVADGSIYGKGIRPLLTHPTIKEPYNHQRQRLPVVYHQNGYVDIVRYTTVMEKQSMSGDLVYPYEINLSPANIEVDTEEDFLIVTEEMEKRYPS